MTVYNGEGGSGDADRGATWTRWLALLAGILLFIAPWILGYAGNGGSAFQASLILGALIVIFSLIAMRGRWALWLTALFGLLAVIAPWVLGFTTLSQAFYACLVLGAITFIVSLIGALSRPHVPAA